MKNIKFFTTTVLYIFCIYCNPLLLSQNTIDNTINSLVKIQVFNTDYITIDEDGIIETKYSYGTGIYVSNKGHILTNAHVVKKMSGISQHPITCIDNDNRLFTPIYLWKDDDLDIALLQDPYYTGSATNKNFIHINSSLNKIQKNDKVITFGFPNEIQNLNGILAISKGEILDANKNLRGYKKLKYRKGVIVTSNTVSSGFSGGLLTDINLYPIGIIIGRIDYKNEDSSFSRGFGEINLKINTIVDD